MNKNIRKNNTNKSKVSLSALALCGITAGAGLSAARLLAAPADKTKPSVTAKVAKTPERNAERNAEKADIGKILIPARSPKTRRSFTFSIALRSVLAPAMSRK